MRQDSSIDTSINTSINTRQEKEAVTLPVRSCYMALVGSTFFGYILVSRKARNRSFVILMPYILVLVDSDGFPVMSAGVKCYQ